MARLIVMKGLPASGKSSYARKLVEEGKTIRVNRDDIRRHFTGAWNQKKEKVVIDIEKAIARTALSHNYNVVIDDTNLKHPDRGPWGKFEYINIDSTETVDFTNIRLSLCVQRDLQRKTKENGRVGRAIINRMALENGLINWDDIEPEDNIGVTGGRNGRFILVDIDGTIADLDHRLHFIQSPTQKDYREFHKRVDQDTPILEVIAWVNALYDSGYTICLVSGRGDECAIATEDWLTKHAVLYDYIFMRRGGDYRADTLIKKEILDLLPKDKIDFVIDDRPSVIRMWKENGLRVFPVSQDRWVGRE